MRKSGAMSVTREKDASTILTGQVVERDRGTVSVSHRRRKAWACEARSEPALSDPSPPQESITESFGDR